MSDGHGALLPLGPAVCLCSSHRHLECSFTSFLALDKFTVPMFSTFAMLPLQRAYAALQLNIVTFLAKRLFDTTKVAQAGNAGIPFKKVLEEAKFLSLPRAKVGTHRMHVSSTL